jgi:hypothetical protein
MPAPPTLTPVSQTSKSILTSTGSVSLVSAALPYGVYSESNDFLEGAAAQVSYTYRMLGGDVLDIELTAADVYSHYEISCLEYSYLINTHQIKNTLSSFLGNQTGSFDHNGELKAGPLKTALSGTSMALKYPRFDYSIQRRVGNAVGAEIGVGGVTDIYSASFAVVDGQQDYDLQAIVSAASSTGTDAAGNAVLYQDVVGNKKVKIHEVFFKSPYSVWRFYGAYGGVGMVGNLHTYGQYADDSTFELVPTWQNKLQAQVYEDSLYTRVSHYSYEIINNNLRIYPVPSNARDYVWFRFSIDKEVWEETATEQEGVNGVNNFNTVPFDNIPYANINSVGKQWIRRFSLALSKETLGQIRSKFGSVPIPGESVTLNGAALVTEGKAEQDALREELKKVLDELTYSKIAADDAEMLESVEKAYSRIPTFIYVG